MAFKITSGSSIALDSPERMFRDFTDRKLKGLLTYQGRVVAEYQSTALEKPDVAFKLPTGSGKTLVGLLIAEWRRRKFGERVVYLCPTKQLVNQVAEEACTKYGMAEWVYGFTGSQWEYDPRAKSAFQNAELVAITSYNALFNTNPFFDEPQVIIFDDAHAAENYLIGFWTFSVERNEPEHKALFQALVGVLQEVLPAHDLRRMQTTAQSPWDYYWVDKVPLDLFASIKQQVVDVIDVHVSGTRLRFPWSIIRDHLDACHMYVGSQEITIRPLLPPTKTHEPCRGAIQRLYMSATLGEGGDLERLTGVRNIHRLGVPEDLDAQGVGRRFFVFPGRSLSASEQIELERRAIERAGRAVVLVPDFRSAKKVTEQIAQSPGYPTFTAAEIEESKAPFIQQPRAVAIMANRYDGIDFPDDQCRLLIMNGLPGATNLQERFLLSRMGARLLLNDRIRTRVVQAVGRCTRSTTDYSAVFAFGEDLLTYLSKRENREFLHPELQAEIAFGLDQSRSAEDMIENLNLFYERGEEWRAADNEIRRLRGEATQRKLPSHENLAAAVPHEIDFQYALWNGDGAGALAAARKVLTELKDSGLQGYRALWNYLAGCAASKMARDGVTAQQAVAREYYALAARAMPGIPWLRDLAGAEPAAGAVAAQPGQSAAILVARLEGVLDHLGTMHDQRYAAFEKDILEGLASSDPTTFERAHKELGSLLGFEAGKEESKGSPDPWWLVDESLCFVFEDHSDARPESKLSVSKARQVALHPNWIRERLQLLKDARILPILVTSVSAAEDEAAIHLKDVAVWPIEQLRVWAVNAVQMVRQLRVSYPGAGDMFWRQSAMEAYEQAGADPASLMRRLKPQSGRAQFVE
jgi:Type III restriction enzyme, res subunit/Helicase C-terminal domain